MLACPIALAEAVAEMETAVEDIFDVTVDALDVVRGDEDFVPPDKTEVTKVDGVEV